MYVQRYKERVRNEFTKDSLVRSFFIVHAARELQLVFPSSFATATTIRSMHATVSSSKVTQQQLRALSMAFVYAMVCRVVSQFAIGFFWVSVDYTSKLSAHILTSAGLAFVHLAVSFHRVKDYASIRELGMVRRMESRLHRLRYACGYECGTVFCRW